MPSRVESILFLPNKKNVKAPKEKTKENLEELFEVILCLESLNIIF